MKISLEIDLEPHLTAEELAKFRSNCEKSEIQPDAGIANLIRAAIKNANMLQEAAA